MIEDIKTLIEKENLQYQNNLKKDKPNRDLETVFLKSVFPLEIMSIPDIYFLSEFKKLYLLTSAGNGGLRKLSLKVRELEN